MGFGALAGVTVAEVAVSAGLETGVGVLGAAAAAALVVDTFLFAVAVAALVAVVELAVFLTAFAGLGVVLRGAAAAADFAVAEVGLVELVFDVAVRA